MRGCVKLNMEHVWTKPVTVIHRNTSIGRLDSNWTVLCFIVVSSQDS